MRGNNRGECHDFSMTVIYTLSMGNCVLMATRKIKKG